MLNIDFRILIVVIALLPFVAKGAGDEKLIPANWAPSLSETENACKAELEKKNGRSPSQQEMNEISARLAEVYDAQMFITYVQLFDRLETGKREHLFREQQQWLRERETKAADAVQSKGGSLAALEYSGAFADLTQKRIAELQSRLRQQAGNTKQTEP
jgi:uncharacterized protein YecT (DUF1311 family)